MTPSKTKPKVKLTIEMRPPTPAQEAARRRLWGKLLARAINKIDE